MAIKRGREPQNIRICPFSQVYSKGELWNARPTAQVRIAAPTENTLDASEMRTPLYV